MSMTDRRTTLEHPDVRIGDREREQAADRLSGHAAAGRLSVEELEERLERVQAAVFTRELAAVEADLPGPRTRSARGRRTPPPFAPLVVLAAAVALSVAVGHPIAPLFFLAVLLLWRAGRLFPAW